MVYLQRMDQGAAVLRLLLAGQAGLARPGTVRQEVRDGSSVGPGQVGSACCHLPAKENILALHTSLPKPLAELACPLSCRTNLPKQPTGEKLLGVRPVSEITWPHPQEDNSLGHILPVR